MRCNPLPHDNAYWYYIYAILARPQPFSLVCDRQRVPLLARMHCRAIRRCGYLTLLISTVVSCFVQVYAHSIDHIRGVPAIRRLSKVSYV
jgi:hypothetical protein